MCGLRDQRKSQKAVLVLWNVLVTADFDARNCMLDPDTRPRQLAIVAFLAAR
jgi:hypothetical protein